MNAIRRVIGWLDKCKCLLRSSYFSVCLFFFRCSFASCQRCLPCSLLGAVCSLVTLTMSHWLFDPMIFLPSILFACLPGLRSSSYILTYSSFSDGVEFCLLSLHRFLSLLCCPFVLIQRFVSHYLLVFSLSSPFPSTFRPAPPPYFHVCFNLGFTSRWPFDGVNDVATRIVPFLPCAMFCFFVHSHISISIFLLLLLCALCHYSCGGWSSVRACSVHRASPHPPSLVVCCPLNAEHCLLVFHLLLPPLLIRVFTDAILHLYRSRNLEREVIGRLRVILQMMYVSPILSFCLSVSFTPIYQPTAHSPHLAPATGPRCPPRRPPTPRSPPHP
jgi:hypothetical protein